MARMTRGEYYRLIASLDSAIRQAAVQHRSSVVTTDINEYDDKDTLLIVTIAVPQGEHRPDSTLSAVRAHAAGDTIRLEEGRHEAL